MSLSDEELRQVVEHLAQLNNVSPGAVVAEVLGDEPEEEPAKVAADSKADPKKRGWTHWVAWSSAFVVMGVLVGASIVAFLKFVNDPAEASIPKAKNGIPAATATPDTSIAQLAGQTFSLKYPRIFDQVSGDKSDKGSIEQYRLSSTGNYRRLIAADVRQERIASLSDDASYKIRQLHPETYSESSVPKGSEKITVMTKLDGREQTLFWLHGSNLMIISVTSTDAHDKVADFMKVITASVRWNS